MNCMIYIIMHILTNIYKHCDLNNDKFMAYHADIYMYIYVSFPSALSKTYSHSTSVAEVVR